MPEYKTPLPGILAATLESAINRLLDLDQDTPARLERLEGRMLQLDIEGVGITLFFAFNGMQVESEPVQTMSPIQSSAALLPPCSRWRCQTKSATGEHPNHG